MKFTKGPWEVIKHSWAQTSIMAGPSVICQSDITWECDEDTQDQFEDKQDANAHLIAAAPDLYNACQLALIAFENNANIDWGTLERALKKARGES